MKSKQLVILILLAAILGGAVWYLKRDNKETWSDTGAGAGGKVIEFPINDVATLTIQSSAGTVNLVRKEDVWIVQERADYPANFERIGSLLRKLWELKTVQEIQAGPSQFVRFDLVEPAQGAGTRVDFKDKDGKPIGALLVGKKFMKKSDSGVAEAQEFPAGRYVMTLGSSRVSLVSESLDDVDPKPEGWLQREFIKIENPSIVTLAGATDAQKWKLTRENAGAEWKLADAPDAEKVDAAKVSQVARIFASPTFVDALNPDAKPEDTGLDKPAVITFATFDGFTYVLKVGKETGGNHPVTVEVSAQLAKERAPGKEEKPEDKSKPGKEATASIVEEIQAQADKVNETLKEVRDFKVQETLKRLEEKLAAEKKFEGRPFLLPKATIDQIIKDRTALLPEKNPEPAPGTGTPPMGLPPGMSFPGATVPTPPVSVPPAPKTPAPNPPQAERTPITVTTPPVSIPPAPQAVPSTKKTAVPQDPKAPSGPKTPAGANPPVAPPAAK